MDFAPPEPPTELGRYRILSPKCGLRVSPLQLGGMSIGDAWSGFMGSMNKEQAFELLDAFVAAGGNFIDTANDYQNEQFEAWLGEWMKLRGNRDQLVIATKFTSECRSHASTKLQTDIDILYLHWWDHTTSIEEVIDSIHTLVDQGKVLYLGISNTPAWIVGAANTYASLQGKTPFCIYQGRWNVMNRDFEREIIPTARHFGMALAPWDVLGAGKFQSKKELDERKKRGESLRSLFSGDMTEYQTAEEVRMSEVLAEVAAEHGIQSVTAIALAYVLSKTPNVFPLVGGRKVQYLEDNIQALNIRLTEDQVRRLEAVRPFDPGFPSNFIGADPKVSGQPSALLSRAGPLAFVQSSRAIGYEA
ncbi:putative aryl-alcohol dehydrogenase AAD14 [Colletotrichum gloeosporioides]|uniref:Putative aryl-alcohol dehydrogenase AAD14 n=1 Tax=Colletotrichum gloeosporioides TaxID=474922 RepID=A0A8H4CW30_COLGL|nr:putative aryl-alcohol dehydrogenase AAD14 [Colletotrichum gloeosporioides]KAF3810852.1 putative aryl-alcohol dehydrogenase AAD14 [Colletotrichum gloeosporioides]